MSKHIIKHDINFLDKPLWFQYSSNQKEGMVWKDIEGYIYRAGYKVPDKVDALFLIYLLMRSQQQGYTDKLILSRYEILKDCEFIPNDLYYARLEDSLERWKNVSVKFQGTFYDGIAYKTISFGIIDTYSIRKEDKRLEIRFSPEWLLMIERSTFFKYINFDFYKTLKRPVSRRLFEILCKSFHGRDSWEIDAVKLGQKLTLSPKKVMAGGVEKEVLYPSVVLIAIKPAINEINKNILNPDLLKEAGLSPKDAFTVSYKVRNGSRENKVIEFTKMPVSKVCLSIGKKSTVAYEAEFSDLLQLLKQSSVTLEKTLLTHYQSHGSDFVRSNILYANKHAKRSYIAFLKKSLAADWAAEERSAELLAQAKEQEKQKQQALLQQKLTEIAKAKFVTLPGGQKHKIKRIQPDGWLMFDNKGSDTYLSPEHLWKCHFE